MKESDILHESGEYWISTAKAAGFTWDGFCVWKVECTHSVLKGRIGFTGEKGMRKAIQTIERMKEDH